MTCFRPRPAWRDKEPNANGKHQITFSRRTSQLEHDYLIPCGKCGGCTADKRMEWGIRMYHESITANTSTFLTLTYSDDYLPADGKISVDHARNFLQRTRDKLGPIRYYLTGEYGDKTKRPHYHALIFNEDFCDDRYEYSNGLYGSHTLDHLWGRGIVQAAPVSLGTAFYTAGYASKKLNDSDTFNIMSRRPPIGYDWAMQNLDTANRTGTTVIEGQEFPIPKTYFKWHTPSMFRPQPIDLSVTQGNRAEHTREFTSEELRNKEAHYNASQNLRQETL